MGDEEAADTADSGSTGSSKLQEDVMRANCSLYAELLSGYENNEGTMFEPSMDVSDEEGYQSRKRARRLAIRTSWHCSVAGK